MAPIIGAMRFDVVGQSAAKRAMAGKRSAFSAGGWKGDPPATPPTPAVEPDGTPAPPAPDATAAEKAEWEKQFPGGVEELWKGYNELRTKMSRGEHLAPPVQEPKPEETPPSWRAKAGGRTAGSSPAAPRRTPRSRTLRGSWTSTSSRYPSTSAGA